MAVAMFLDFICIKQPGGIDSLIIVKAVRCFSPYTNLKKIAKTTDSNASGQLGCLNGMRYGEHDAHELEVSEQTDHLS